MFDKRSVLVVSGTGCFETRDNYCRSYHTGVITRRIIAMFESERHRGLLSMVQRTFIYTEIFFKVTQRFRLHLKKEKDFQTKNFPSHRFQIDIQFSLEIDRNIIFVYFYNQL